MKRLHKPTQPGRMNARIVLRTSDGLTVQMDFADLSMAIGTELFGAKLMDRIAELEREVPPAPPAPGTDGKEGTEP